MAWDRTPANSAAAPDCSTRGRFFAARSRGVQDTRMRVFLSIALAAVIGSACASAQQPQATGEWAKLPHMELQRQFAGPLQDTIVQRWRDPVDGTVCYIYLPITA